MVKYIVTIALMALLSIWIIVKVNPKEEEVLKNKLIIGLQNGYPPFEFVDKQGNIVGFDVDLGNLIAKKLGKKLVIKEMDFEGEILSLKQGKIDLIISGMNITPSRLKEIDMVPYYGAEATSMSLIFWESIPQNVLSLNDLAKLAKAFISVESGSTLESYLKKFPQINIRSFQGALNPLLDVKYGKSIANLVEPDVGQFLKNQYPQMQILNLLLEKEEKIMGFGIGIKKGNQILFDQIKDVIQNLKDDGILEELERHWFKEKI